MHITLHIEGKEYSVPFRLHDDLATSLKEVKNAAHETFNSYCYDNKLGRYADR